MPAKKKVSRKAKPAARKPMKAKRAPARKLPKTMLRAKPKLPGRGGSVFDEEGHKDDYSTDRFSQERGSFEAEDHPESPEELEYKMHTGEKPTDVYTEEGREELLEDDEVEDWEEGFSKGAEGRGSGAVCPVCKKPLAELHDKDAIIEREFGELVLFFCSNNCATRFAKYARKRKSR